MRDNIEYVPPGDSLGLVLAARLVGAVDLCIFSVGRINMEDQAPVAVTIVMATFNGGVRLSNALESMTKLDCPDIHWHLIVVDNASTDETPEIIDRYESRLPLLHLHCAKRGKSAALNSAIPYFRGTLIIFTDDDVIVPADWISKIVKVSSGLPAYDVIGGRVTPLWPHPPSSEFLQDAFLGNAFAIHDFQTYDGPIDPGKIWGPNMTVRSRIFVEGYRFNETFGPAGGNYIPGSESSFNIALAAKGCKFYFSNSIVVQHQIRAEQLTKKWIRLRGYRLGKGQVHWESLKQPVECSKCTAIFPRWYIGYLMSGCKNYLISKLRFNRANQLKASWDIMVAIGMISEAIRLHKKKSRLLFKLR